VKPENVFGTRCAATLSERRFCHIDPKNDRFPQEACRFILPFPITRQGRCAKPTKKRALNGQNAEYCETA
jgi:hypothetical protein